MTPEQQKLLEQLTKLGDVNYIKSNKSRYELIANAISEMNTDQLEILVENYLRTDKKEEFLENIKFEFNKFRDKKDDYLIAYEGICEGSGCNNYRQAGYSFTGNNSDTFYNLVFEEENGECSDICKCSFFKVNKETIYNRRKEAERKRLDSYNFTDEELDDLPF